MLPTTELTETHWYELNRIEEDEVNWAGKTDLTRIFHLEDLVESGLVKTNFPYSAEVHLTDYGWQVAHAFRRWISCHVISLNPFVPPERTYTQAELDAEQESAGQLRLSTL